MKLFKRSLPLLMLLCAVQALAQEMVDRESFFENAQVLFNQYVQDGWVDYQELTREPLLGELVDFIAEYDYSGDEEEWQKAYLINVYNLLVIKAVVEAYPIQSTLKIYGFFDQQRHQVGPMNLTLDELEKEQLLGRWQDARFHFALACAAVSCPPLASFAFLPDQLDGQLDSRTASAVNNGSFIRVDDEKQRVMVSQIFQWYKKDFGGSDQAVRDYINRYRQFPIPDEYQMGQYAYDWTLNANPDLLNAKNANRYVVSSTIPVGGVEAKWFNNLYSQQIPAGGNGGVRDGYFTSFLQFVYGVSSRLNIGFDARYRRFSSHPAPASPFRNFDFTSATASRSALATFGPKIRWAPKTDWPNFSIQSALWFPLGRDLTMSPWLDWNGPTWWTQVFNDFDIGSDFALFTEVDLLIEDMGSKADGRINRWSTPVTGIFSYFPSAVSTTYLLVNFSPYWAPDLDYFFQTGLGAKYQFSPQIELELLYTYFLNAFITDNDGKASTINVGIRYSTW